MGKSPKERTVKNHETRHRGFMPISFIRLNSYEMSQSLIVQGLRDLAASCTLMFQYELSRKNVAEMWRKCGGHFASEGTLQQNLWQT